jgi:hypothetical protein
MRWLYAKSLELAILLKGAPKPDELPPDELSLKDFIRKEYDPFAEKIMNKIIYHEQESKRKD